MSNVHAAILRRRARRLRALASSIERTPAMTLERHAGADTWRGGRPLLCNNLLLSNLARLHHEVDGLRWQAYLFERRATDLEAQASLLTGQAG